MKLTNTIFILMSSCATMSVEYTADVYSNGRDVGRVKVANNIDTTSHMWGCIATGVIYGGWCWMYLSMPTASQEKDVRSRITTYLQKSEKLFEAELRNESIQHKGWQFAREKYSYTSNANNLDTAEIPNRQDAKSATEKIEDPKEPCKIEELNANDKFQKDLLFRETCSRTLDLDSSTKQKAHYSLVKKVDKKTLAQRYLISLQLEGHVEKSEVTKAYFLAGDEIIEVPVSKKTDLGIQHRRMAGYWFEFFEIELEKNIISKAKKGSIEFKLGKEKPYYGWPVFKIERDDFLRIEKLR